MAITRQMLASSTALTSAVETAVRDAMPILLPKKLPAPPKPTAPATSAKPAHPAHGHHAKPKPVHTHADDIWTALTQYAAHAGTPVAHGKVSLLVWDALAGKATATTRQAIAGNTGLANPLRRLAVRPFAGQWQQLETTTFLDLYADEFPEYLPPSDKWKAGLTEFLGFLAADKEVKDIRWAAYILATTMHECRAAADGWKALWVPVAESGGAAKDYGQPELAVDEHGNPLGADGTPVAALPGKAHGPKAGHAKPPAGTKTVHTHKHDYPDGQLLYRRYYGRGYVQITHQLNYRQMGQAIGRGYDLVVDPEVVLRDHQAAYDVSSKGMRDGSYRHDGTGAGYSLSRYLNSTTTDYTGARAIINGDGKTNGAKVAGYAKVFEVLLRAATPVPLPTALPAAP